MTTGISMSNYLFRDNLKSHLRNKNNHINLIFSYLDYGLNYKFKDKNQFEQYESDLSLENAEITEGCIIPNYFISNKDIRLRELLKIIENKELLPTFYVILNSNRFEKSDLDKLKLFDNKIALSNFNYKVIVNSDQGDTGTNVKISTEGLITVSQLQNISIIVIRPDFLIELVVRD